MIGHLSDQDVDRLLREQTFGHLGCSANGRTYVIPMSYAYEAGVLYGHTAEGLKLQIIRINPEVCFQVESIAGISSWRSAVVWGTFEVLGRAEGEHAMRTLLRRLQPHLGGGAQDAVLEQLVDLALSRGVAYKITPREKSGRFES